MVKKILVILLSVLLLSACGQQSNMYSEIEAAANRAIRVDLSKIGENNCVKKYYSYYQSKNVGRVESDDLSNIFLIDGNSASLSLDVTSIVNDSILTDTNEFNIRDIGSLENPLYSKLSLFTNRNDEIIPYKLSVADCSNNQYFIMLQTSQFVFMCLSEKNSCVNTIYEMILLLRTALVETTQLILDYSSDSLVSNNISVITIFEEVVPESGYLIDYVNDWKDDTTFIKIDNTANNNEQQQNEDQQEGQDQGGDIDEEDSRDD
ncbi:MAG: hypothetical protein ACI4WG_01775 [Erysipelotrichaceae bacterium]